MCEKCGVGLLGWRRGLGGGVGGTGLGGDGGGFRGGD